MKKIRNSILAGLAALAIVLGGISVAAPAQALWGTSVYVYGSHGNGWVRTTNMVGTDKILHRGETARNVNYFCPPSFGWEIWVTGPGGTTRGLDPGQCYRPTKEGAYDVAIWYAGSMD